MRKSVIFVSGFLLSALALWGLWLMYHNDGRESAAVVLGNHDEVRLSTVVRKAKPERALKLARVKPQPVIDEDDDLPPAEKTLLERIEKALEEENLKAAVSCAEAACVSPNKDIRQTMVDTLGWFGKSALPELTPFLADVDEDVRESAQNEWSMAVSDIEDDCEKIAVVEMAMNVISDEDFLEDISNEYIGVDEKVAVESLMRIIADGKSEQGVAKAKETYEFVTGDEWQNADGARRWLAEEYEPPES